jgi:hypothetical protein
VSGPAPPPAPTVANASPVPETFALGNRHTPAAGGACPGSPLRERLGGSSLSRSIFQGVRQRLGDARRTRGFEGCPELTQSCHVRPHRPHLPWPMRVRCRRSPSTHCVSRRRGDGNGAPLVQARGLRGLAVTARETRPSSPGTGLSRSLLRVDYWPDLARVFSLPASGSASMEAFRDQSRLRAARLEHLVASPPTAAPTAHAHVRGFFASGEEQMAKQLRRTPWNGFLGIHGCGKPGSQDVS